MKKELKELLKGAQESLLKGNATKSINIIDEAISSYPKNAIPHYNKGVILQVISNNRHAIFSYDEAIKIDENMTLAYINRGSAYESLFEYDNALKDYTTVIDKNPDNHKGIAFFRRGMLHNKMSNYQLSISDLSEVLKIDPSDTEAYFGRGIAHYKSGSYGHAKTDFIKATDLNITRSKRDI